MVTNICPLCLLRRRRVASAHHRDRIHSILPDTSWHFLSVIIPFITWAIIRAGDLKIVKEHYGLCAGEPGEIGQALHDGRQVHALANAYSNHPKSATLLTFAISTSATSCCARDSRVDLRWENEVERESVEGDAAPPLREETSWTVLRTLAFRLLANGATPLMNASKSCRTR
jgi:hypothetical protein